MPQTCHQRNIRTFKFIIMMKKLFFLTIPSTWGWYVSISM